MTKAKQLLNNIEEIEIFNEMSNIRQSQTGLPMIVWFLGRGGEKHGPRLKVQSNHSQSISPTNLISITISDNPELVQGNIDQEDFKLIKKFILLNKDLLLKYWNHELSTIEFLNQIKKI